MPEVELTSTGGKTLLVAVSRGVYLYSFSDWLNTIRLYASLWVHNIKIYGGIVMIGDSEVFKNQKHYELCEELLVAKILERLKKDKIINFATYNRAEKEMNKYE